ncbi:uncharacterized protein LOC128720540 [Anopheles nili]|uniref:uncharacterized protein LOC128720540 n=1 Tax=Anopheles nili TaxID=185578 RepID=UPI00237AF2F6|nr:uncharacterized protein LOC128720540 [Anopheles nili]
MHVSAGLPANHFLPSPALASPVGSTAGGNQPPNPPLAANAPCSTLFVANLGQFVSEHELKEIFASLPGFCRLRLHTKGSATSAAAAAAAAHGAMLANGTGGGPAGAAPVPVAFVEFKDVVSAAAAMAALQGKFLLSSDRGAMRIEFAKSKMAADIPSHQFYAQNHAQLREHIQPIATTIMNHSNHGGNHCISSTGSTIMNGGIGGVIGSIGGGGGMHGRGVVPPVTSMTGLTAQNAGLFTFAVAHPRA